MYTSYFNQINDLDACILQLVQLNTSTVTSIPLSSTYCSCGSYLYDYGTDYHNYDFWIDGVQVLNTTSGPLYSATYRCTINSYNVILYNTTSYTQIVYDSNAIFPVLLTDYANQAISVFDTYSSSSNQMVKNVYNFSYYDLGGAINSTVIYPGSGYTYFSGVKLNDSLFAFSASINTSTSLNLYSTLNNALFFQTNITTNPNYTYVAPLGVNLNSSTAPAQTYFLSNSQGYTIYDSFGTVSAQPMTLANGTNYIPTAINPTTVTVKVPNQPYGFISYYMLGNPGSDTNTGSSFGVINSCSALLMAILVIIAIML